MKLVKMRSGVNSMGGNLKEWEQPHAGDAQPSGGCHRDEGANLVDNLEPAVLPSAALPRQFELNELHLRVSRELKCCACYVEYETAKMIALIRRH